MMKKIFIFFALVCFTSFGWTQELSSYKSKLSRLESDYRQSFSEVNLVDDLQSKQRTLSFSSSLLADKIKDYIDENNIKTNDFENDYIILYNKATNLKDLCSLNTCDCFSYLISLIGNGQIIKEQNGIRICFSRIGNFKLFYAYSQLEWGYTLSVNSTNKLNTTGNNKFGIAGEIEIFRIKSAEEKWYITSVSIIVDRRDSDYSLADNKCKFEFPRW